MFALPKRLGPLGVLEPVFALVVPPKREPVPPELVAPKRGLFGVLLPLPLPPVCPKLNDIMSVSMKPV